MGNFVCTDLKQELFGLIYFVEFCEISVDTEMACRHGPNAKA